MCALVWLACPAAWAGPGDHIRPSDTITVIPTVDVGTELRTNIYRSEASGTPGANLRLSPGLAVAAEGPDHRFGVSGDWDLRKYYYVGEVTEGRLAGSTPGERIRRLDRFNDFGVSGDVELFKRSSVGLEISNRARLRNTTTDFEFADQPFNTHFRNELEGGIRVAPTSALSITPGGRFEYDDYRVASMPDARYNARSSYGPQLELRWSFLPRTALVLEGRYTLNRWGANQIVVDDVPSGLALPDSEHVQGMVRLDGQLTTRLHANVGVGWGAASYDETTVTGLPDVPRPNLDGPYDVDLAGLDGMLVVAQLRWLASEASEISAGYEKAFEDSFFTNFFTYHYLYAGTRFRIGPLVPTVKYGVRLEDYEGVQTRRDVYHRMDLDLGYELADWAGLGAGVGLQARDSEQLFVEYNDWTIHLMGRFQY